MAPHSVFHNSSPLQPSQPPETAEDWPSNLIPIGPKLLEETSEPPRVLLTAERDSERRLIATMLRREGCRIVEALDGTDALAILEQNRFDLVILDRDMMRMDGLECCRRIKARRLTALTPVLMVTRLDSVADEIAGIQAGADEYLIRPLHPEVFRTRIRALIRHKNAIDRLEETESILFALAQAVEKRDHYTAGHCQRLAIVSVAFGVRLGLSQAQLLALYRGGYLHDIGKIAIPDSILFKAGRLSEDEWVLMKTHSVRGEEICRPLHSLESVLPIIRNHHERWDGGGYPDGLRGQNIPLLARVLQFADIYDALITIRPYKPAYSREHALEIIQDEMKKGWRDPDLTRIFATLPFDQLEEATAAALEMGRTETFESSLINIERRLRAVS